MNEEIHNRVHPVDILLIVVFCIAFFGYRLGSFVPLSDHEGYVAVTAQEALEGNWLVPHFNGQIRLQKTPLMYWTVAATATILHRLDEFVVRLPSALSASGIAVLLTILGAKMFTRQTGLITGLATASAAGMLWQSHVGTADMLLSFFTVASMLAFYTAIVRIDLGATAMKFLVVGYLAFGLGMLAKGPVPIVAVAVPLFAYLIWAGIYNRWLGFDRDGTCPVSWRRLILSGTGEYLRPFRLPMGLVIFLVVVGAWVIPVLIQVPDAYWRWKAEYVERYLGEFGVRTSRPWYYYFPQIFLLTLPWSIFLPVGLALPFRRTLRGKRHELMFLFLWLVVGFVLFSLSVGKRAHYILPIVPPAIMLSTVGMIYTVEHVLSRRSVAIGSIALIAITGAMLVGGYFYVNAHYPEVAYHYRILGSVLIAGELLALLIYFRLNLLASTTIIAVVAGICFAIIWPLYPKVANPARDPKLAADRLKRIIGSDATIYSIGKADGPLVFYYGRRMEQTPTDMEIAQIFKARDKELAIVELQETIADRVMQKMRQPQCVYFLTSDTRFQLARAYAKKYNLSLHEIAQFPGFYTDEKSMVLFSNQPKSAPTCSKPADHSDTAPAATQEFQLSP